MRSHPLPLFEDLSLADRILFIAHDLFYRDGIRGTGIDRLIAESGVAKKTFYRYYPTKDHLVLKFLEYRHVNWMQWFDEALKRHGGTPDAIAPALEEWFKTETYRGCAFINAVVELGDSFPEAVEASQRHKADMTAILLKLLPASADADERARALTVAVDGAIVSVQFGHPADSVLTSLSWLVDGLKNTPAGKMVRPPAEVRNKAGALLAS